MESLYLFTVTSVDQGWGNNVVEIRAATAMAALDERLKMLHTEDGGNDPTGHFVVSRTGGNRGTVYSRVFKVTPATGYEITGL